MSNRQKLARRRSQSFSDLHLPSSSLSSVRNVHTLTPVLNRRKVNYRRQDSKEWSNNNNNSSNNNSSSESLSAQLADLTMCSSKTSSNESSLENLQIDSRRRGSTLDITSTKPFAELTMPRRGSALDISSTKPFVDLTSRRRGSALDITATKEYRQIYADNLRLYSTVIARQMASYNGVGRQMDDIRRHRNKQKTASRQQSDTLALSGKPERGRFMKRAVSLNEGPIVLEKGRLMKRAFSLNEGPINNNPCREKSKPTHAFQEKKTIENNEEEDIFDSKTATQPRFRAALEMRSRVRKRLKSLDDIIVQAGQLISKMKNTEKISIL